MSKFEEKTLHSEKIFEGKVISLRVEDVELPNGQTSKRELIDHPGAVAIIAITKENKIILVEQYRKALEKSLIEIPAGKLEPGELPEITALRELEEETGYTTDKLTFVTSFYTSPGFANEMIYLYLAENLEKMDEPPAGDEDEFIDLMEMSLEEAKALANNQRIQDAKTNYAILFLDTLLRN